MQSTTTTIMKKLLLSLSFIIFSIATWAQAPQQHNGQPPFDPQKFQQMVENELTKAADFTSDEAKAFFPLYNERRNKQREMGRQIHQLKKQANTDSKKSAEVVNKIYSLKVEMAQVEQSYYKRILKVVPAEKVLKVMRAEDDFHRRMVQNQRDRHPDGKGRQPKKHH